jgi:2-methylcitrate dehydratase PrpD
VAGEVDVTGLTRDLAEAAVATRFDQVNSDVVRRLAVALTDAVGVGLAGSREPAARAARAASGLQAGPAFRHCVLGSHGTTGAGEAAFLNGIACHALDFDDLIQPAGTHPSCHIVPGLLAAAQGRPVSGRAFLEAYLVGIEVEARLGAALAQGPASAWHATGVVGPLSVAAAVAKLLDCTPAQTAHALGIAASCAAGVRANRRTMTKAVHSGLAAQNGLWAALLAREGLSSREDAVECEKGFLDAFGYRADVDRAFLREFGRPWQAGPEGGLVFKPFPCCAAAYPAIIAGLALRAEVNLGAIAAIEVRTTRSAREALGSPSASNAAEARLSLEFCLSAALARGKVGLATFTPDVLDDAFVRSLMAKTSVSTDGDLAKDGKFGTAVVVRLNDGRSAGRRESSDGEVDGGLATEGALRQKFLDCAGLVLGDKAADAYDRLMGIGEADDIWAVMNSVAPSP